jgi:hypothetical protein
MNRGKIAVCLACAGLLVVGCSTAPSSSVPSIGGATAAVASHGSQQAALHAAAQCVRQHGIPAYQDPVVAPDGSVYTDQRSVQDAERDHGRSFLDSVRSACQSLFTAAHFNPENEPKATPALVAAGVRAAQCFRAHNMPNYRDPTANSTFTPGHGFGLTQDEMPPGGKASGVFQQAVQACRAEIDAENQASTLQSLSHG